MRSPSLLQSSLLSSLLLTVVSSADAQLSTRLVPGTRIRVSATAPFVGPAVGTVVELRNDTLVLLRDAGDDALPLPFANITALEISRGRRSKTGTGAGIGVVLGGLIGAGVGAATYTPPPPCAELFCFDFDREFAMLGGALVGALGGAVIGAAVGSAYSSERWHAVRAADVLSHVSLAPVRRGGLALAVSMPF